MTSTTISTAAAEAIQALTAKGRETMTAVGNWTGSWFDAGCTAGSGIWAEAFMNEMGHKSTGVINRLRDLGLFESGMDEDGVYFSLTELGVEVAEELNRSAETPAKEEPAAPAAKKTTPAKKTAAKPAAAKAYKLPKGYVVKWPHGGHDLLAKADKAGKGPAWYVACNEHGDLHEAKTAREAEQLGAASVRAGWCKGDHKAKAGK